MEEALVPLSYFSCCPAVSLASTCSSNDAKLLKDTPSVNRLVTVTSYVPTAPAVHASDANKSVSVSGVNGGTSTVSAKIVDEPCLTLITVLNVGRLWLPRLPMFALIVKSSPVTTEIDPLSLLLIQLTAASVTWNDVVSG